MAIIQQIYLAGNVPSGGAAPPTVNFQMFAGDDAEITITVLDSNGQPINLTDCTVVYGASLATGGTLWTKTATNLDQGTNIGQCKVSLSNAETDPLGNNTVSHRARLSDDENNQTTIFRGTATFLEGI